MAGFPTSVSGFTVIPVTYSESSTHVLYARAHTGSKKSKAKEKAKQNRESFPEGRTLFLVNVPPDATEREISQFFKGSGTVERVVFDGDTEAPEDQLEQVSESEDEEGVDEDNAGEDESEERPRKKRWKWKEVVPQVTPLPSRSLRTLRRTGRTAHIIFLDESSLSRALSPPPKARLWPTDPSAPSGLAHYQALYESLRPPLDVVRAHADTWMELFEYEQAKKRQKSKYLMGEAVVDKDGFTLVTRGGAYGKTLGGGVGVANKKFQREHGDAAGKRSRNNKKKEKKEAFYAFQIHEKKRQELLDLKQKWEEDKAKVEKLKQSRKFKPY
ncbi:uncharacterized protein LAESUDRAFT_653452 [Laetiporus sulphureus 93-53]|uniref:RRM domain-containing protein n=1 Tax=Laetiporus sulphureus 93-53 TaxID=1314785 RepID=A0A165E9K5_9APHY|nr:uncharacterized protein LAESUDRAFT_653452 [Laetiporus sulphureus 93-53]KZT06532.1 hypothetical protein LAESUDRAFT_653452 [Laetiporus sulphureus 93-53]